MNINLTFGMTSVFVIDFQNKWFLPFSISNCFSDNLLLFLFGPIQLFEKIYIHIIVLIAFHKCLGADIHYVFRLSGVESLSYLNRYFFIYWVSPLRRAIWSKHGIYPQVQKNKFTFTYFHELFFKLIEPVSKYLPELITFMH